MQVVQFEHGGGAEGAGLAAAIYRDLREQICRGVYRAGDGLPSTRALAAELGVSRTTVTAAYDQLASEGFIESRQGRRATVAALRNVAEPVSERAAPVAPPRLSAYGQRLRRLPPASAARRTGVEVDFRYGDLSAEDLPARQWKRAVAGAVGTRPPRLAYDDPLGSRRLREALQAYVWRARGIRCDAGQIVVVNGSQQGIELCARLLVDPGDRVGMENPGYAAARNAFTAAGAVAVPMEVDEEGLRTSALPDNGSMALAYVTPSHQFPLGSVLSAPRRQELLAWARRSGSYVLEDDYDSEYRYDVRPIPPVMSLPSAENVIYLGTASKTLSPALRLGFLVVPPGLAYDFANAKQISDRHSPTLLQDALAALIEDGTYERHVRRVRRRNGARRARLIDSLRGAFGTGVTISGADAGLHVVAWFDGVPRGLEETLIARAGEAGVGLYGISPLYSHEATVPSPAKAGIVMGYSGLSEEQIVEGVRRLRPVVAKLQAGGS